MIYSTVNYQRGGWEGLKKSKIWWRNTWMVPNWQSVFVIVKILQFGHLCRASSGDQLFVRQLLTCSLGHCFCERITRRLSGGHHVVVKQLLSDHQAVVRQSWGSFHAASTQSSIFSIRCTVKSRVLTCLV